ncbi:unnamed protein product [Paramecium pentaurelia]|uniref:Uncharacterized protein n=1 Tax=Paramecium pentaurelia TaxID=43138 RepID=A0A8S1Y6V6_9CILI|nr:unnamed protein product [Paramecium pentaurelia]
MIQLLEQHSQPLLSFLPLLETNKIINREEQPNRKILVVFMVEKIPDQYAKINSIYQKFQDGFDQIIMTLHHYETPKEIPDKISNQNYAIRSVLADLNKTHHYLPKKILFNQFDVDTIFDKTF